MNTFKVQQNIPSFKVILTHPFLTGEDQPKTLAETLKMIPKAKTPPKVKTPKAKTKTPSPTLSTANRKKAMNNMIKKAAAVLAAKPKAKPVLRRTGVARPNPVPESPKAPYGVMSPSNLMNLAKKIESGRKNAKIQAIKDTKEKLFFVDLKGKKREFVRKAAYYKALEKNKAAREEVARQNSMFGPRPKTHPKFRIAINKYVNSLTNDERNVLKKKICN